MQKLEQAEGVSPILGAIWNLLPSQPDQVPVVHVVVFPAEADAVGWICRMGG